MTTRCLKKLDELDRVAEYVFRKHSRQRARSDVESRLDSLRSKLESQHEDIFGETTSPRSSKPVSPQPKNRSESTATYTGIGISHVKFQNLNNAQRNRRCSARTMTPGKRASPIKQKPRSKSVPNCKQTTLSSRVTNKQDIETAAITPRPVSTYGSHDNDLVYDTSVWFNFKPGSSLGVIDAFACDEKNERPLCYKIDPKTGKCHPKLLKHRSAVRIGQNGIPRDAQSKEEEEEELEEEINELDKKHEEIIVSPGRKVDKKRTAPLSMGEQLTWENAHILTPRKTKLHQGMTKNLCQQQPVLYNSHKSSSRTLTTPSSLDRSHEPIYRFCQETHPVKNPDGSGPNRNITSVTIQDFSELISTEEGKKTLLKPDKKSQEKIRKETNTKRQQQVHKSQSEKESQAKLNKKHVEQKELVMFLEKGSDDIKVSFSEPNSQEPENKTKTVRFPKTLGTSTKAGEPLTKSQRSLRPKSSDGKLNTPARVQLFAENQIKKKSRPSTAPPCSPRLPHDIDEDLLKYISSYFPSSLGLSKRYEIDDESDDHSDEKKIMVNNLSTNEPQNHSPEQKSVSPSQDSGVTRELLSEDKDKPSYLDKRASNEGRSLPIELNKTLMQNKQTVVSDYEDEGNNYMKETNSDSEELDDIAPTEALSSLRRKIKEDLEKQTRELELDIQQLYLKQNQELP